VFREAARQQADPPPTPPDPTKDIDDPNIIEDDDMDDRHIRNGPDSLATAMEPANWPKLLWLNGIGGLPKDSEMPPTTRLPSEPEFV